MKRRSYIPPTNARDNFFWTLENARATSTQDYGNLRNQHVQRIANINHSPEENHSYLARKGSILYASPLVMFLFGVITLLVSEPIVRVSYVFILLLLVIVLFKELRRDKSRKTVYLPAPLVFLHYSFRSGLLKLDNLSKRSQRKIWKSWLEYIGDEAYGFLSLLSPYEMLDMEKLVTAENQFSKHRSASQMISMVIDVAEVPLPDFSFFPGTVEDEFSDDCLILKSGARIVIVREIENEDQLRRHGGGWVKPERSHKYRTVSPCCTAFLGLEPSHDVPGLSCQMCERAYGGPFVCGVDLEEIEALISDYFEVDLLNASLLASPLR